MVSIEMFLVAFGYLGVFGSAYPGHCPGTLGELRSIGYRLVMFAVGAIFFAVTRFVRD